MKSSFIVATLSLASLAHLACCLFPLLSLIAGTAGLLAMLDWLVPLRGPLLFFQFSMLGYAGYKAYFSAHAGHRTELMVFWLSVVITLASLLYPYWLHQSERGIGPTTFGYKKLQKIHNK
jgi:hypothetical protein